MCSNPARKRRARRDEGEEGTVQIEVSERGGRVEGADSGEGQFSGGAEGDVAQFHGGNGRVEGDEGEYAQLGAMVPDVSDSIDEDFVPERYSSDGSFDSRVDVDSEYEDSFNLREVADDSEGEVESAVRFNPRTDLQDVRFVVGMVFESFDMLKQAIRTYSIRERYPLTRNKNEKQRIRTEEAPTQMKCHLKRPMPCDLFY